eukprot:scaffold65631_cov39-Phaeocystis_antarctica.AAC.1
MMVGGGSLTHSNYPHVHAHAHADEGVGFLSCGRRTGYFRAVRYPSFRSCDFFPCVCDIAAAMSTRPGCVRQSGLVSCACRQRSAVRAQPRHFRTLFGTTWYYKLLVHDIANFVAAMSFPVCDIAAAMSTRPV